jgi:hypothetical protein
MKKLFLITLVIIGFCWPALAQHLVLQAEDAKRSSGTVDVEYSGYTGTGYVNTANATGEYVEFELGVSAAASNDTLFFVYAHNKSDDRKASVTVNGTVIASSVSFPSTSSWTNWTPVPVVVPLQAGANTIRLTSLTSGGLANLDRMEVAITSGNFQYKLTVKVSGHGKVITAPAGPYFDLGSVVKATAVPDTHAVFTGWSGDTTTVDNPVSITMSTAKSLTATFQSIVAGTLYCSPDGNDTTADGSFAKPFYSLALAVAAVSPGDTIFMRGGTYYYTATVELTAKGTESQRLFVLAYGTEKPVLNWSKWVPADETIRGAARGIKVDTSAEYWYLKGLEICYAPDNGVKCEGGHTTFDQCIFHHNGDGGIQIGLNKTTVSTNANPEHWAAYTVVINCDSYMNADPATSYENADGFACKLYAGKGNYFYGDRSWHNCDDGWDCYQTEYPVYFENCWSWHNGDPALWGLSSFNGDGNGFKLGGANTYCLMTVKRCIAMNCNYGALGGFAYNDNTAPITLLNCTAIHCGRSYNMQQSAANIITNCVDWGSDRPAPKDISSSSICTNDTWTLGITVDTTWFQTVAEDAALESRQADGGLPTRFGKLVAGCKLIDKGTDIGLPFTGVAPDLGAYEFGQSVGAYPDSIFHIPNATSPLSVDIQQNLQPHAMTIVQNYPNPFNPTTNITFTVAQKGTATLKIYDMVGREVAVLFNGEAIPNSKYNISFDASKLASGIYFSIIHCGSQQAVSKMILLK